MAALVTQLVDVYDSLLEKQDPRVSGFYFFYSPLALLSVTALYVYFATYKGPKLMENRKPYVFKNSLIIFNFGMSALAGYTFIELGLAGWLTGYSWRCQPLDHSTSEKTMRMINVSWLYSVTKFIDLFDTAIFVMRKKNKQLSFLHIYHHTVMSLEWICLFFIAATGMSSFHAFVNSFIHFVMYIYYGISSMGPKWKKYLWWKKYLTSLQIIQFVLLLVHSFQLFFMPDCDYPRSFACWSAFNLSVFMVTFCNFFYLNYLKSKPHSEKNGTIKNQNMLNGSKKMKKH